MIQRKEVKGKLDVICNSYEVDENNQNVTISKSDFEWLVYGIDELLSEIEKRENYWLDENLKLSELNLEKKKENEKLNLRLTKAQDKLVRINDIIDY